MRDSDLEKLLRAARADTAERPTAPFGFDTRVVALWRSMGGERSGDGADLARLFQRVVVGAAIVIALASSAAYWQVNDNDDAVEPLTNAYAIADTAIENSFFE